MASKTYVLDTNVLLHDYNCLKAFDDGDVGIPITVLEELDEFKKGHDQLNYNAREITRQIDELSGGENGSFKELFRKGISLGEGKGKVFILTDVKFREGFADKFISGKEDHHILAACFNFMSDNPKKEVVFVSKDVNLRLKARALEIIARDYQIGKIKSAEDLFTGVDTMEDMDESSIDVLFQKKKISVEDFRKDTDSASIELKPNQYFLLKSENKEALARYDQFEQQITLVEEKEVFGIKPRNAEQTFAINALTDDRIKLVTISGTAGTGKTLLALAAALENRKGYKQIFLSRPIVPLSNKDIGYLPGTAINKIEPYMQPLYDNLKFIQNNFNEGSDKYDMIDELQKREKLIISPLAYIRGRTLSNVYFIVDEAQNLSPHEVKTIITRAGEGTKVVFTGDIYQIDSPYLDSESNGLSYIIDKLENQELYSHVTLKKGERSVLSELASKLL
ncbi:MAG: PhoH family protein [Candidatus Delongbacteria bacterium]|jgi:PhoH-like ATPase|nr:PhoH family protein [Candidatus Delongbacteria bacterium]MDD4204588.1 PhoH family protein [Candidatus Delongbacteria bacterium]MDY0017793.1 PhoH family protein [Candidatus Delongbacteria bacterium]